MVQTKNNTAVTPFTAPVILTIFTNLAKKGVSKPFLTTWHHDTSSAVKLATYTTRLK